MKNYYLNLVNPLTSDTLGIGYKIVRSVAVLQGEHFVKEAVENFKLAGIDPKESIVYVTETFFDKAYTVGYSLESYLLKFNTERKLNGYTTESATMKYINKGIKQICELLDNPETGKLVLIDDSTGTESDNTSNEKETTVSIQNILNNDIIKQSTMIELAVDSELRCKTLDELQKTYANFCNIKTLFEDRLKDTHNYDKIISEHKKLKSEYGNISLIYTLDNMFEYDFQYCLEGKNIRGYFDCDFGYKAPIEGDSYFFYELYYDEEHELSMFKFMNDYVYGIYEKQPIAEVLNYYRNEYKNAIDHINKLLEHTIKLETIITELHNKLINNPSILAILKMTYT